VRKKILRIIISPVIVLMWLIRWTLYFVGSKSSESGSRNSPVETAKNPLEIMIAVNEELLVATDES